MTSISINRMRQYQHACEEVQARLQALQVQQQPGIQSLSIASQPPQGVLPLLR